MTLVAPHGPFDEIEYAWLHKDWAVVEGDGAIKVVVADDGVSGPGASLGGWLVDEELLMRPRLSDLCKELAMLPPVTIRTGASMYYEADFLDALVAAAIASGWKAEPEAVLVVLRGRFKMRQGRRQAVEKAQHAGATVLPVEPLEAVRLLSEWKAGSGYDWQYDPHVYAKQVKLFPDRFRATGVRLNSHFAAICLEVRMELGTLMTAWHQSAEGRQLGATDLLLATRMEDLFTSAQFVDMGAGVGAGFSGLVSFKEGFGALPYLRWRLIKDV